MVKAFFIALGLSVNLLAYNSGIEIGNISFESIHSDILHGSGKSVEKQFLLKDFREIEVDSSIDITVKRGLTSKYIIVADDNLIDVIAIKHNGDKIEITDRRSYETNNRLHLTIITKKLNSFKAKGSATIEFIDLKEDTLKMYLDESITLKASGYLYDLDMRIEGTCDVDLEQLFVKNAHIEMSESSDLTLQVEENLEAKVSDNASLVYSGTPTIRKEILDNGELEKND